MGTEFLLGYWYNDSLTHDAIVIDDRDGMQSVGVTAADLACIKVMRSYLLETPPIVGVGVTLYDADHHHIAMVTVQEIFGREDVKVAVYRFDLNRLEWYSVKYVSDDNDNYLFTQIMPLS